MPIVRFIGRIIPPGAGVNAYIPVGYRSAMLGLELVLRIRIENTYISVEIDANEFVQDRHFGEFYVAASHPRCRVTA